MKTLYWFNRFPAVQSAILLVGMLVQGCKGENPAQQFRAASEHADARDAVEEEIRQMLLASTNFLATDYRTFRDSMQDSQAFVTANWDSTGNVWRVLAGAEGLLFGRYVVTFSARLNAAPDMTISGESEPTVRIVEVKRIRTLTDGREHIEFSSHTAEVSPRDWAAWLERGFPSDIVGFTVVTNEPVKNAYKALQSYVPPSGSYGIIL